MQQCLEQLQLQQRWDTRGQQHRSHGTVSVELKSGEGVPRGCSSSGGLIMMMMVMVMFFGIGM